MMIKRGDIYWITLIIIEIMFIVALVWFATHSLCVTHEEFLAALGIIITGISGGFWALWSKISELTREIGYIRGKLNEKKGKTRK
ncbi:MAG: hypothetical protein U9N41_01235 [Euryarchaeota archaeon]|nr:hypothetical protein [Euryarchaeota archaeon]